MTDARENLRTIETVTAVAPGRLRLVWSTGEDVALDLRARLRRRSFKALSDPNVFNKVQVGDWGHSVRWTDDIELGADSLWLDTLTAVGKDDAREFLEWRLRHGLSLTKAAEALDMSRRMIAYYSNGEKPVPKHVLLACKGWEAVERKQERDAQQRSERLLEPT